MKKLNISSQLFLIVTCVVLFVSTCFTVLTYTCIKSVIDSELYSRLQTYLVLIDREHPVENPEALPDIKIGYYINEGNTVVSKGADKYITSEELNTLINKIKASNTEDNKQAYYVNGKFLNSKTSRIYYVCVTTNNLQDYKIVFTDADYPAVMLRSILIQLFFIFFVFVLITAVIIVFWSNKFVKRIDTLQKHILNLPKEKYEVSYVDDSCDEIGELSRSVETMRVEIFQNEKTKQEMLQNLSHDFKTPIAVIKSYAEAYQDGMADADSAKIIVSQAELLKKKVNRLLQFNSLEYLTKDKEFESVNMSGLINEIVQTYKYQTELKIETDLDPDVTFLGYRENFYTVVDNILDNAKRYAKSSIKIILKPDRLRIYNDGEHIDAQFLNSVFKPYEKGSKGEFGLGMSIVKRTVEFFGYSLHVVNEEVGVSFIIEK